MNQPLILSPDGNARRTFTVTDLARMTEAGILLPDERVELVRGGLIPMAAKGLRHEVLKIHLNAYCGRARSDRVFFAQEAGWTLDEVTSLEPDFLFFPASKPFAEVTGGDALLVIEIAAASRHYDLGLKADTYARHGVRELWVIEAATRDCHVHQRPTETGYADRFTLPAHVELQPEFIGNLKVRLADLQAQ